MAFKIVTADERMAAPRSIKGVIFGPHGIGKTSLLWTLDPSKTLFINLEAGELAVQNWPGDMLPVESWRQAVDLACLASGPDESLVPDVNGNWPDYSKPHFDYLCGKYPRAFWAPQIEGSKAGRELLGIFDEVISMVNLANDSGSLSRAFVCMQENQWKSPAKDRSGKLDLVEKPHLGELMDKIAGPAQTTPQNYTYGIPESAEQGEMS